MDKTNMTQDATTPIRNSWTLDDRMGTLARILRTSRPWHGKAQQAEFHPAVTKILANDYVPLNWHLLTLEWPHLSTSDPTMLAYTQTEAKGEANLRTRVKPGRYIKRHFPQVPDDVIRDAVASIGLRLEFTWDLGTMIEWVQTGPSSCMSWKDSDPDNHPYNVYFPGFGWGMARLMHGDCYIGRALVLKTAAGKGFVRTYQTDGEGSVKTSDVMQSMLDEAGYQHYDGWPRGTKLDRIDYRHSFLLPYIDGDNDCVDDLGCHLVIRANGEGDYCGDNTDGTPTQESCNETCDDCDERVHEDSMNGVGPDRDSRVCDSCLNSYTYVTGLVGRWPNQYRDSYYVADDQAVEVDDCHYDSQNMPAELTELSNGDWAHVDNTVTVDGDVYHVDDDDIVHSDEEGCYILFADSVQLAAPCRHAGRALRENCVKTRDGWVPEHEASEIAWSEGGFKWAHDDCLATIEIDETEYVVHEDEQLAATAALSHKALPLFSQEA